ncbi:MAG: sigma-70 family RNA polymerase sigma factor [Acidobacteria bacterium]|nr:sigma-70 family RNA polymerase sigma factor [Acidobacteriota bacterium]
MPLRTQPAIPFADLVRENQAMVYSIALHHLREPAVAEELAQDVFLHLHRVWSTIESAEHARNWLRRAITHRSIDHGRRRALAPSVALEAVPEPAARTVDSDPFLGRTLRRMVAALPVRARMMVLLRYQEDLSAGEIAEMLDVSIGTVKSTLHRALGLLKEKMQRQCGETVS